MDAATFWEQYGPLISSLGGRVLGALVLLVVGLRLINWLSNTVQRRFAADPRIDDTLGGFFSSILRYVLLVILGVTILQVFGVDATSLVAVLGAATLAIGFALQGTLSNMAAGVMLIFFRPFKVGQFVEVAGHAGTVSDLDLFTTVLNTVDNVQIIIANGDVWGSPIKNFAANDTRRVDLTFGISYDDDIQKATDLILGIAGADGRVLSEPAEPWVRVVELNESSVDLQLRAWVNTPDYWNVRFETLRKVKETFDANGIEIPYPHAVEIQRTADPKAA